MDNHFSTSIFAIDSHFPSRLWRAPVIILLFCESNFKSSMSTSLSRELISIFWIVWDISLFSFALSASNSAFFFL